MAVSRHGPSPWKAIAVEVRSWLDGSIRAWQRLMEGARGHPQAEADEQPIAQNYRLAQASADATAVMSTADMPQLHDFLREVRRRQIRYRLSPVQTGTMLVELSLPGWHWETRFFLSGRMEVTGFRSATPALTGRDAEAALTRILIQHDARQMENGSPW